MVTRRELLKGAALSAGALIRIDPGSVDVAAQEVSATAVRLFFLSRTPAAARHVPERRPFSGCCGFAWTR